MTKAVVNSCVCAQG